MYKIMHCCDLDDYDFTQRIASSCSIIILSKKLRPLRYL